MGEQEGDRGRQPLEARFDKNWAEKTEGRLTPFCMPAGTCPWGRRWDIRLPSCITTQLRARARGSGAGGSGAGGKAW
eukprot:2321508-Rhodomonas_salina.2